MTNEVVYLVIELDTKNALPGEDVFAIFRNKDAAAEAIKEYAEEQGDMDLVNSFEIQERNLY